MVVSVNNSERQTSCPIRYKLKLKPVSVWYTTVTESQEQLAKLSSLKSPWE
jgi:hypothetical protein